MKSRFYREGIPANQVLTPVNAPSAKNNNNNCDKYCKYEALSVLKVGAF